MQTDSENHLRSHIICSGFLRQRETDENNDIVKIRLTSKDLLEHADP